MALFRSGKKKVCAFCGAKAGFWSGAGLAGGERICGACAESRTSAWVALDQLDRGAVETHMAALAAQRAAVAAADEASAGEQHPGTPYVETQHLITFHDGIGMFSVINRLTPARPAEFFRYDQIAAFTPLTANPMLASNPDQYVLRRVGLVITLVGHPWASRLELLFAERLKEDRVDLALRELDAITTKLDALFGIPQVAGLASSVAGTFGVRADVERRVYPDWAENAAKWTAVADAAMAGRA